MALAVNRAAPHRRVMGYATAEKRIHLLTRQDLPGVHQHLPGVVRHLRTLEVRIDWAQLIGDLSQWSTGRDRVAKRWLQDFYRTYDATNDTKKEDQP
jgi:CRISPR system Cascade subunit CasB